MDKNTVKPAPLPEKYNIIKAELEEKLSELLKKTVRMNVGVDHNGMFRGDALFMNCDFNVGFRFAMVDHQVMSTEASRYYVSIDLDLLSGGKFISNEYTILRRKERAEQLRRFLEVDAIFQKALEKDAKNVFVEGSVGPSWQFGRDYDGSIYCSAMCTFDRAPDLM